MYEGWIGAWINPGEDKAGANQTLALAKNFYGSLNLTGNKLYFDKFGGAEAVASNATSIWQLSAPDM